MTTSPRLREALERLRAYRTSFDADEIVLYNGD